MQADTRQLRAAFAALIAALLASRRGMAGAHARTGDLLRDTCHLVLHHAGRHARLPAVTQDRAGLQRLAQAAHADLRAVALDAQVCAGGLACAEPLLVFAQDDGRPLALLPCARGARIVDLTHARRSPLGGRRAPRLQATAWAFDLRLPDTSLTWPALLRWTLAGCGADLLSACSSAFVAGLAPLALPLAGALLLYTLGATAWLAWDALAVAGLAAWLLSASAGQALAVLAAGRVGQRAAARLQTALLDRLLRWPPAHRRMQPGASFAAPLLGIAEACASTAQQLVQLVAAGSGFLLAVVGLCWLDLRLAGIALAACAAVACLPWLVRRVAVVAPDGAAAENGTGAAHATESTANLLTTLQDLLRGRTSAWQAGATVRSQVRVLHALAAALQQGHGQRRVQCLQAVLHASAFPLGLALLLWAGLGDLPAWRALAISGLFLAALHSLAAAQCARDALCASRPLREVIAHWLALPPVPAGGGETPSACRGALVIQSVDFRYKPGAPAVLQDFTLSVRAGECLAITGPSGCGKSTLLRLLMGLEQPQAGAIHLDGRDLSGMGAQSLRAQVGALLQEATLGSGDIYAILAAGRPLTPAAAWHALWRAGLAETVRALPLGLATPIVDDGAALSRSQRQRLLLARTLAQAPAVLLLDDVGVMPVPGKGDEPAALPPTRIVVTHTIAVLRQADRIAWLDEGRVLELGSWDELIALGGRFAGHMRRHRQDHQEQQDQR